ncbi:hypothetical protein AGABI1DRAFT_119036 [Agaricus bisporus var. burnettii JB137-S8]|uniref:N-acetyltransferase domain-containing protein n=1 Tax=Agaricus bisporus var. burnettii (strain JB137-S8 / ATCC MYA-4627 / FGSC 10392) TaxID=597362 RepID=K5X2H2_AGABU|nr:uncharacterized protein AGABI1DRAFT_119036 [Agaricus bisporus var. burnettii JB137-S8]EKM82016.1 hypothetical protein AGABI1DRAFT_119036 [Agaricus bisporus var. burnettii JB137-S8]
MDALLPEFLNTRLSLQEKELECDDKGSYLRPLTRSEVSFLLDSQTAGDATAILTQRKLKLSQERRQNHVHRQTMVAQSAPLHELKPTPEKADPKPLVLSILENIKTTPFESSFLSRLQGTRGIALAGLIGVDWETITPWMSLMRDIQDHYGFVHPEQNSPMEDLAPITYSTLQASHLPQTHDLLERSFWTGIDVSDTLEYYPERCTVVACYKCLVVGVAIISSPQDTYITYLAVRVGWDKTRIARTMLFHLIKLNPKKDITLHVSANNSAMLLYNQFGFKAEEFIAGFYEDYLDPASRASKNAFRLRLRQ